MGVTHHPALWSPDLPRGVASTRSPGQPVREIRIGETDAVLGDDYLIKDLRSGDGAALAAAYRRNREHRRNGKYREHREHRLNRIHWCDGSHRR